MNQVSDIINDQLVRVLSNMPPSSFSEKQEETETYLSPIHETPSNLSQEKTSSIDIPQIRRSLYAIKDQIDAVLKLLNHEIVQLTPNIPDLQISSTGEKIIEGVFNGEKMVGSDGQEYTVPPNYASKSKIVEGDMMKLTIAHNGRFIYKQIGPVERKRVIGTLIYDEEKQLWYARHEHNQYKILTASVTFYRGKPGDEVIILLPEGNHCDWGAVENIISR
ncbi:MAG TPA: hypothetical protein DCS29_00330 [Candidatus Magasanikbacteria bacterium]|nr:hypothetical protein [Candidatus Magasanikbacteria bacterium]